MKVIFAMLSVLLCMVTTEGQALETRIVKVKALNIIAETEGPYVEDTAKQAFALPSSETAVNLSKANWDRLVAFLRKECARTVGCELTVETETEAVVAVKAPSGKIFEPPYGMNRKIIHAGTPVRAEVVLQNWMPDTYALMVQTNSGNFCILNGYAYKDYYTATYKFLSSLGEPGTQLKKDVVVTYFASPGGQDIYDDCKGHLAKIQTK